MYSFPGFLPTTILYIIKHGEDLNRDAKLQFAINTMEPIFLKWD